MEQNRPEYEIQDPVYYYESFPYQWLSLSLLVHDLQMEHARSLRCDWYNGNSFWKEEDGSRTDSILNTVDLSLAYVISLNEQLMGRLWTYNKHGTPVLEYTNSNHDIAQKQSRIRYFPSNHKWNQIINIEPCP
jgi:hypothetical protein